MRTGPAAAGTTTPTSACRWTPSSPRRGEGRWSTTPGSWSASPTSCASCGRCGRRSGGGRCGSRVPSAGAIPTTTCLPTSTPTATCTTPRSASPSTPLHSLASSRPSCDQRSGAWMRRFAATAPAACGSSPDGASRGSACRPSPSWPSRPTSPRSSRRSSVGGAPSTCLRSSRTPTSSPASPTSSHRCTLELSPPGRPYGAACWSSCSASARTWASSPSPPPWQTAAGTSTARPSCATSGGPTSPVTTSAVPSPVWPAPPSRLAAPSCGDRARRAPATPRGSGPGRRTS